MDEKTIRRGVHFSADVAPLVSRMPAVDEYRESLLRLQSVWDSLSMMGQMSGAAPDIGDTRSAFQSLTETLLDSLARRLLLNATQRMRGHAQVAVDILVRNLFERTADVGFLSTDAVLRRYVARARQAGVDHPGLRDERDALEARFRAYVAKYSVYDDIVVLSPQGRVLARLDRSIAETPSPTEESWVRQAQEGAPYTEFHGRSALMGGREVLLYANAVRDERGPIGVLALSFRFDDEMAGIFRKLLSTGDGMVLALVRPSGEVLASSDRWQVPHGAPLPPAGRGAARHSVRFCGRAYLSATTPATGYEGYGGPGWSAQAMLPLEQAFEIDGDDGQASAASQELLRSLDGKDLFDAELRAIPEQARRIQGDLSRLLWNGKLRQGRQGGSAAFGATLLREIGATGDLIRGVFEQASDKLLREALNAVFHEAADHAALAIDIMDRNLYERANDCRWWALDGVLRRALLQRRQGPCDAVDAAAVLRHINGLYTVYSLLVLFDAERRVVAVSRPGAADWVGRTIDEPWAQEALGLQDPERYVMSPHAPHALYEGRSTYVYAAAVLAGGPGTPAIGGVGIVFDGERQFAAMLRDSLAGGSGSDRNSGLLMTRGGRVVASTDARWRIGEAGPALAPLESLQPGESATLVVEVDGAAFCAGVCMSSGYREYRHAADAADENVAAVMLTRLGEKLQPQAGMPPPFEAAAPAPANTAGAQDLLEIAGFLSDGLWLGLPSHSMVEALSHARIAPLPNAPAHLRGLLPYGDALLPVVDLASLRGGGATSGDDAPVVVVQASGGRRYAVKVQGLGPVFDAPAGDIQPAAQTAWGAGGERLVKGLAGMLTLLDPDALLVSAGLAPAPPPAPGAQVAAAMAPASALAA